ncbi:hypothetical protein [Micromonospora sediminicola]|uniref:hypothetical protein n=1 Tax=Micromonospora sediminicola TaxID=946078 RepID=UPI0037B49762
MSGQPESPRDVLHRMIAAVAQREYGDSITSHGTVAHADHIGSRIAAEIINLFDGDIALYRSLLPAGTRTEEQFAAMYTLNGEIVSPYPEATTRQGADVLVKGNNVQRAVDPDWRVDCTVVRRQQHTTPWEPVEEKP